jgi:hypothetical protein
MNGPHMTDDRVMQMAAYSGLLKYRRHVVKANKSILEGCNDLQPSRVDPPSTVRRLVFMACCIVRQTITRKSLVSVGTTCCQIVNMRVSW